MMWTVTEIRILSRLPHNFFGYSTTSTELYCNTVLHSVRYSIEHSTQFITPSNQGVILYYCTVQYSS